MTLEQINQLQRDRVERTSVTKEGAQEKHEPFSKDLPAVSSISVRVCHLFMATNQVAPLRRQLKSMTSLEVSLSRAASTDLRRSRENLPSGKRNEVIMTFKDSADVFDWTFRDSAGEKRSERNKNSTLSYLTTVIDSSPLKRPIQSIALHSCR